MLADRLRIKRRNPYVPEASTLVAVTFWDILGTGAPVQAFRVYDPATMTEVTGIPTVENYSPHGAFSPGGTYYAVILQEAALAATLKIYNVADWTEAFSGDIPGAANDTGHVSWSPNGRFVCAFVGPAYLFLDADNAWASSTITLPAPNSSNYEYTSAFIGNRELVVGGSFDGHVSIHYIDENGPPVALGPTATYTSISGDAIADARMVSAKRPTEGQGLGDVHYAIYLERGDGAERIWVLPWNSTTRQADLSVSASGPVFPNMFYLPNNRELVISDANGATPRIRRFDVASGYTEMTSLTLSASTSETIAGYSLGRESLFIANNKTGNFFVLAEYAIAVYDGGPTFYSLIGSHDENVLRGYPTSVSVSDWPVNTLLPPPVPE